MAIQELEIDLVLGLSDDAIAIRRSRNLGHKLVCRGDLFDRIAEAPKAKRTEHVALVRPMWTPPRRILKQRPLAVPLCDERTQRGFDIGAQRDLVDKTPRHDEA